MMAIRAAFLMVFSFGIAIMAKYYGFHSWVENNTWIALPMIVIGAVGLLLFMREGER